MTPLQQRQQRIRQIRARVAVGAAAVFVGIFGFLFGQLSSGHDPALASSSGSTTTSTATDSSSSGDSSTSTGSSTSSDQSQSSSSDQSSADQSWSSQSPSPVTTQQS
jgi:hypothetical protein